MKFVEGVHYVRGNRGEISGFQTCPRHKDSHLERIYLGTGEYLRGIGFCRRCMAVVEDRHQVAMRLTPHQNLILDALRRGLFPRVNTQIFVRLENKGFIRRPNNCGQWRTAQITEAGHAALAARERWEKARGSKA